MTIGGAGLDSVGAKLHEFYSTFQKALVSFLSDPFMNDVGVWKQLYLNHWFSSTNSYGKGAYRSQV
jgi:hypothetical protein